MLNPERFVGLAGRWRRTRRQIVILQLLILLIAIIISIVVVRATIDAVHLYYSTHGRLGLVSQDAVGAVRLPANIFNGCIKVLARGTFVDTLFS